jgi:Sad1 / UNC-like C-terminal
VQGWVEDPLKRGASPVSLLEEGHFDVNGPPLQSYRLRPLFPPRRVHYVTLEISSNHGSKDYTCLYGFRLHAAPQTTAGAAAV